MEWHQKEIDNAINDLDSSNKGLSSEEAKKRLTLNELMFTLALSSLVFFAVEIEKWWFRRKIKN